MVENKKTIEAASQKETPQNLGGLFLGRCFDGHNIPGGYLLDHPVYRLCRWYPLVPVVVYVGDVGRAGLAM